MKDTTRRYIMEVLAAATPAVRAVPMASSITLPAHAETTKPIDPCSAEAGCYDITSEPQFANSIVWSGGVGPSIVTGYDGTNCSGATSQIEIVVSTSAELAAAI